MVGVVIGYNAAGVPVRSAENPRVWSPYRGDIPASDESDGKSAPDHLPKGATVPRSPATTENCWRDDMRLYDKFHLPDAGPGDVVRLYEIGAIAAGTGKKSTAIRKWIEKGVIPDSTFRTRSIYGTLGDAGRRLWTREQIEAIVRIGREEGVIGTGRVRRMADTNFVERIRALWLQNDW
jgi:hypothetical protein